VSHVHPHGTKHSRLHIHRGIFISSWAQDRWGYRGTLQIALVFLTGFIFIVFFASDVKVLFAGELLCGLPWGAFSSSAVSYASDVTPIPLRGYLTTYINLCWIIGQLLGAAILRRVTSLEAPWGYRVPFAVQWVWPIPLFILVTLAPESPWHLVRHGRLDDAKKAIMRLSSTKSEKVDPAATVAMMVRTNEIEIANEVGSTYVDCYKGTDLRRTEISCFSWVSQTLCGMVVSMGRNARSKYKADIILSFAATPCTSCQYPYEATSPQYPH
jgi:SP family general alpha glucoside:H+ symporter-like MFS transporter